MKRGKGAIVAVIAVVICLGILGTLWYFIGYQGGSMCREWSDKIEEWRHELNGQWLPPPSAYDEFNSEVERFNAECA